MSPSVMSTSDEDLLSLLHQRLEHSERVTAAGWKVARHGFNGLSTSTSQRAAQFALRQELQVLNEAYAGVDLARTNALAAVAQVELMPQRLHNAEVAIGRLPDELISYILELGMVSLSHNESATRPSICVSYTEALSRVSHRWRQIALGTPLLWTCIIYDYPMTADDIPDITRFATFLERSKAELLDISLTYEPRMAGPLRKLSAMLQTNVHRCRRLELNLSNFTVGLVLPLTGALGALETLDVCVSDFSRALSEQPDVPIRLVTEGHQCRLLSLHLAGSYAFKRSHLNPSRLSRLRYIADGISFSSVARFSAYFSNLRSLELTALNPQPDLDDVYVLPSLRSLSIVNVQAFPLLCHLEAPNLRHMHLWIQPEAEADSAFISPTTFPSRSHSPLAFPHLRTFSLTSSTFQSNLVAADVLARYIGAHGLLRGVHISADVLGLDTLMMLAAIVVDSSSRSRSHSLSSQSPILRIIRVILRPPRPSGGEVFPATSSLDAEMAELLAVFIRCVPGIRIQVQGRPGEGVPEAFTGLRRSYPRAVKCASVFGKSVVEVVDDEERARRKGWRRRDDSEEDGSEDQDGDDSGEEDDEDELDSMAGTFADVVLSVLSPALALRR